MVEKFNEAIELSLFKSNKATALSIIDIQLAAAILMFEVIKADEQVTRSEVAIVIDILRTQFLLQGEEIGRLLEMAGDVGNENLQLESFTAKISKLWHQHERLQLLGDFWQIAIADDTIDERETELIERIARLLDLDKTDIAHAHQTARRKLGACRT